MKKIRTPCASCVFAVYDNKEQVGCEIDRLRKFLTKGKAEKTGSSYEILDICNAHRPVEWLEIINEDKITAIKKSIQIPYSLVIHTEANTIPKILKQFTKTIESIKKQEYQPRNIFLIVGNFSIDYRELYSKTKEISEYNCRIIRIVDNSMSEEIRVDQAIKTTGDPYCLICRAGSKIRDNLIENFNSMINNELRKLLFVVNPNDLNHESICQTALHNVLGGNKGESLYEKLKQLCKEQSNLEAIHELA